MTQVMFYMVSALSTITTITLSYLVSKQMLSKTDKYKKSLKKLNDKIEEKLLENEVRKYATYATKLEEKRGLIDKIETLINRSNINKKIKLQINAYMLIAFIVLIFICTIGPVYRLVNYLLSAVIISAIISIMPVIILDIIGKINSQKTAQQLAAFITILNRWCYVKEDIFYAFEKSIKSLDEPLKTYVAEMVIQIKTGIDPEVALDILRIKVNNAQFNEFIININQNIKSRGDTKKLLTSLESQFHKIKNEMDRRKISTMTDRVVIYVMMALVFISAIIILKYSPEGQKFYLHTDQGKLFLTLFSVVYAAGIYFTAKITEFKY